MRKLIFSALLVSAAFGLSTVQGSAGSYGYNGNVHHAQYGGNWGGNHHQEQCYWERKQVRIWDESYHRWTFVWRRVRVCH